MYETSPRSLAIPIAGTLAATLLLWLALGRLTRDVRRSALATSLAVALFFSYASFATAANVLLEQASRYWVRWVYDVGPRVVIPFQLVVAAPLFYLILRRLKDPRAWSDYLNAFSVALVALPIGGVAMARAHEPSSPIIREEGVIPVASRPERRPDIYYIVLDAYARSDVMKELFDFDNGPFLDRLERKGFYVARDSRSNYCMTTLSLCSTLNCNYLDALISPEARDKNPVGELIRDNLVAKSLRPLGYKFVAFATGYDPTECTEADRFLSPRHPTDNFQMMVLRMTPMRHLPFGVKSWDYYATIRERLRFILDRLPEIAEEPGPKFTFAHIIAPHHPFVLGANGEDVEPETAVGGGPVRGKSARDNAEDYRKGYRNQAIYLTRRIEQVIDQILARSPEPPIIILQSDHGSGLRHHLNDLEKTDLRERMSILNCYYFPDRNEAGLTRTITPVNSFRVLFNNTFGTRLPLLEDRSLFSALDDSFTFTDVTSRLDDDRDRGRKYTTPDVYPGVVH